MLSKAAREAIVVLGVNYLKAKGDADHYEAIRKAQGKVVVDTLKENKKRKVKGTTADGKKIVVGFANRTTSVYDPTSLQDALRDVGLLDRVLKTVIDEDALAALLSDETLGEDVIQSIKQHITVRKTPYPVVRPARAK